MIIPFAVTLLQHEVQKKYCNFNCYLSLNAVHEIHSSVCTFSASRGDSDYEGDVTASISSNNFVGSVLSLIYNEISDLKKFATETIVTIE